MTTVADSARIPPELAAFRTALVLGEHATGVEIIDRSLAAVVERAEAQAKVASDRESRRPDAQDIHDARVWNNFTAFERMISERPLGSRPKHAGRPWNLRGNRSTAPAATGSAGRNPQSVPRRGDLTIEW